MAVEKRPVLAIDTCLSACSAAVISDGRVLATRSEPMERGHQERLAPLVKAVMEEAGLGFSTLTRVGVTIGPGSFTGLRVGLAFAKGLGLSLDCPVVGVGTLQALAFSAGETGPVAAVIDARREQVYFQPFRDGRAMAEPQALSAADAAGELNAFGGPWRLVGSGALLLEPLVLGAVSNGPTAPDPVVVARLAAASPPGQARPVYLRAPDAKLPA